MKRAAITARIPYPLRQALEQQAERQAQATPGATLTDLVERYLTEGLARDHQEAVEEALRPMIEKAVWNATNRGLGAFYNRFWDDMQHQIESLRRALDEQQRRPRP